MNTPFGNEKLKRILFAMWRSLKPWLSFIAILLILRFTGALSGISSVTNRAVLLTGVMDADPSEYHPTKELFDYNFSIKTLTGESIDFNQFKGKPVFLNLWATWCGPCRAEMPSIQNLYNTVNKDSITFIMLSLDAEDEPQKVSKYVDSKGFTFPVFIASDLPAQLQVKLIPTTFVIDKDGTMAYKKAGMADYDTKQFRKFLDKLMAK
jgi:thiol-disulfide isomerase/thioredoxin